MEDKIRDFIEKLLENKKRLIIIIVAIALIIGGYFLYKYLTRYIITVEVKQEEVKVNLFDTIDVSDYLVDAYDSKGNNFKDSLLINVEYDDIDVLNNTELSICGNGSKTITYLVENNGISVKKTVVLKVVTDPNDKDYKPNREGNSNCPNGVNSTDTGSAD